jgi:hypothetical protein
MTITMTNNNQSTVNQAQLSTRFKTVNLTSFLSKHRANNTLYEENSIDASTEEVYELSTYTVEYKKRTSTLNYVEQVVYWPNKKTMAR